MLTEADRIQEAIRVFKERPEVTPSLCACLGPRKGEPECRCRMRFIVEVDGIYYQIRAHADDVSAVRYEKSEA